MFETSVTGQVEIPGGLDEVGSIVSNHVYTRISIYWLHVSTRSKSPGETFDDRRTYFLSRIVDLLKLQDSTECEVTEICLVSPPRMNGTNHWQMDVIKEISEEKRVFHGYTNPVEVFVLANGERYSFSIGGLEGDVIKTTSIYVAE